MPYALVPKDYTLEKVTKQQEAAVNSKRRHDDVLAFLENPTTPFLVGGVLFTGVLSAITAAIIVELDLPDTDEVKERLDIAAKKGVKAAAGGTLLGKIIKGIESL
jgi:hypothetical protein